MKRFSLFSVFALFAVCAFAQTPSPTPTATESPTATPARYPITAMWNACPASDNVTRYTLYWSTVPVDPVTGKFPSPAQQSVGPTTLGYTISVPAGSYFIAVTATNGNAESGYSNIGWKRVPGPPPPPGRPNDLHNLP